jgi:4'-phosphopantetheinyl transferase
MVSADASFVLPGPVPAPNYPPRPDSLREGEVHVWLASLSGGGPVPDHDARLLDAVERGRADRFLREGGRARFIRSRVMLRRILGGYEGRPPADLRLGSGSGGKPCLIDPDGRPECGLRFNLSHGKGLWALAVRRDAEVGIDVERTTRTVDIEGVAERLFAPGERAMLRRLRGGARRRAFFRVWTAREALVKCLGAGMFTLELDFEVEADPDRPLAIQPAAADPTPEAILAWHIAEIPALGEYRGALVTRGRPKLAKVWTHERPGRAGGN